MRPLLLYCGLLLGLACLATPEPCVCNCDGFTESGQCECECRAPRTACMPGTTKVCPETKGKCGRDTPTQFCPKDATSLAPPSGRMLEEWVSVRSGEALDRALKSKLKNQEVRCKGIPKFTCDFVLEYTVGGVESVKPQKCNHRKNFAKCPVELETKDGCIIKASLYNKKAKVYTKGKLSVECPFTTAAPPASTTANMTGRPVVKRVGDGCSCLPDLVLPALPAPETRQVEAERETRVRGRVTQQVQCKGVPKFDCDFIFDYEACSRLNSFRVANCGHRKPVKKCPVELVTRDGCVISSLLTNRGEDMLASPTQTKIDWGAAGEVSGFMKRCVCLG